jgi:hypothetical protein
MAKGAYSQYMITGETMDSFLQKYEWVLTQNRFLTKQKQWDGRAMRHKAIFGTKGKAFAMRLLPFGNLTEKGNRYGAEALITPVNNDLHFSLLVIPYMVLFDSSDAFMITQGIFEKIKDDERCRQKHYMIMSGLTQSGVAMTTAY